MPFEHRNKNKGKRAHLFLEIILKAAMLVKFDCAPFLAMVKEAATPAWVRLLSVSGDGEGSCNAGVGTDDSMINCFRDET
jgi:hypothetical protein